MRNYSYSRSILFPLFAGIISVWASSQAQIVITRDEIPSTPGVTNEFYVNTEGAVSVDVGHSGGPQTWDFSQGSTADSVVDRIVLREETPFGDLFPEANLVYDTDGLNIAGIDTAAGFLYMRLDERGVELLGSGSQNIFGVPLAIVLDSSMTMIPLSLEYGASWSDSTAFIDIFRIKNPAPNPLFPDESLDVLVEIEFATEGEVDGWGTVVVPHGRHKALRVKHHDITHLVLSVFLGYQFVAVFDSTLAVIVYEWYAEGLGSIVTVTSLPDETNPNFTEASRVRRLYRTNAIANRPPEILSDSTARAVEDRFFTYAAIAIDPDDDSLAISFAGYPGWLSPSDSVIAGTPVEGTRDTSFTVIATDGLLSDSLVVRVAVLAVNDPPVIVPLPDTSFVSGDSVLLNLGQYVEDVDSPDSALFWSAVASTESVEVTIQGDRAVLTAPDFEGTAEVAFTVVDDSSASDTDTMIVTVFKPINRRPVITSDSTARAVEDRFFSYAAIAIDPDGDSLAISFADYPGWLSPSDSVIAGTPVEGTRDTSFTVIATDGLLSDSLVVRVAVLAVNDPPVIVPLPDTSFVSGDSVLLNLGQYVEDVDSPDSALFWSAVASTESVEVTIQGDRAVLTAPNFEGTADVAFTVVDDSSASDTDTMIVTVLKPTGLSSSDGMFVPEEIYLFQNEPNPFNPTTHIRFAIPSTEQRARSLELRAESAGCALRATLKIYNILGQEVQTLVDAPKKPGWYTVLWDGRSYDGNDVPSGIYFSVLQAGGFSATRKMALIR
ncbi:MAG: Ig-like domain-containing protein [bacterium]